MNIGVRPEVGLEQQFKLAKYEPGLRRFGTVGPGIDVPGLLTPVADASC